MRVIIPNFGPRVTRTLPSFELTDHLTVYIDYLGFSEATEVWPDARLSELVGQLHLLANWRRDHETAYTLAPHFKLQPFVLPNISTFSDHLVISYPMKAVA